MVDYSYQTTAIFDGHRFCPDGRGYYYNSHLRKRLHQCIWEKANGPIPKGYEIHHIDGNPDNNDLSNLACIPAKEHRKIHSDLLTDEQREFYRRNIKEKALPASIKWRKSEAGRKAFSDRAKQMWKNGAFDKELVCSNCGKIYTGHIAKAGGNTFCSNACKSAYRRKMGFDNIIKVCPVCGKEFECSKYADAITCSRSCSNRMWHKRKKEEKENK